MRLCYLANGQSIHTEKWIRYFENNGHDVHLVSFEKARIKDVTVHYIDAHPSIPFIFTHFQTIREVIRKIDPDVLHAHYLTVYGLCGALSGFKPFVATAWGSDVLPVQVDTRTGRILKLACAAFVVRKASLITCDGSHVKEAIRKLGVAPEKIMLINFGIDTQKFNPEQKDDRIRMELRLNDSPTVISLRSLEPLYDIESLIRSIPTVLKEVPESQFVIVGKGSEERKLEDLAKSLGISDNTRFIGFIPNDELPFYLTAVDVYVSTALSDAGLSASTAEAMACGLPVIVTDVADNRKWVSDGINGFVVPVRNPTYLAERIIYLLRNKDIRTTFGKISRGVIEERNDYYREMNKMEDIYKRIVQRHR